MKLIPQLLNKAVFILALLIITAAAIAQKKKPKEKEKVKEEVKKEEVKVEEVKDDVMIDMVVEEVVMEDVRPRSSSSPGKFVSNIKFNNQYEIYGAITNDYDWFFDRYSGNERRYGIVNKMGEVILPNIFVKDYSRENDVLLRLEERYGVYDLTTLRWGVPIEYELLSRLSNSLYIAKKNGQYGIIDGNNAVIVPFEWAEIESISGLDNYVIVRNSSYQDSRQYGIYSLIEKKLTVPCQYSSLSKLDKQNYFKVQYGSKFNVVDIQNIPRFKQWYDEMTTMYEDADHYIVKINDRYGVIDDNEKAVIPIEYLEIARNQFSDGSHLARNKLGKYGFIRLDGQVTLPFEYDNLKKEYNSNIVSVQNGKCGLVQVNSGVVREIVTCDFDDIRGATNKIFIVEKNKKYGLLNDLGKPITDIEYQSIELLNNSGNNTMIKAKKDNSYWLLNQIGKPISSSKYEDISIVSNNNTSYWETRFTYLKAREKGGKYSLIDKVGMTVTKPMFDDVVWETQNLVAVKSNGKYGIYYILNQTMVLDYIYDQIVSTKNYYIGFVGNKIEFFQIASGKVVKIDTQN